MIKSLFTSLEKFNIIGSSLGLLTGLAIAVGSYALFAKNILKDIVREELKEQLAAAELQSDALRLFEIGREHESFEMFDKSLKLHTQQGLNKTKTQSLLSSYLWCVANSKSPELHRIRIQSILKHFEINNITPDLISELQIAYFYFNLGELEEAKARYENLRRVATVQDNNNAEAAVYFGLALCCLAEGDPGGAFNMYKIANEKDPYSFHSWIPNENDPKFERWSKQYNSFRESAQRYHNIWQTHMATPRRSGD